MTAAERRRGYDGWFSARTAGSLKSIRVARGIAFIDFRDFSRLTPSASSPCGSELLLAQLDKTAMQFTTVKRTVYSFDGSRRSLRRHASCFVLTLAAVAERRQAPLLGAFVTTTVKPLRFPYTCPWG